MEILSLLLALKGGGIISTAGSQELRYYIEAASSLSIVGHGPHPKNAMKNVLEPLPSINFLPLVTVIFFEYYKILLSHRRSSE